MANNNKLGRGLGALIPSTQKDQSDLRQIKVTEINPNPKQPRKQFDEEAFNELVVTIKQIGVIQPVVVRKAEDNFQIIAGERRWRAAKEAGLKTLPCVVKDASQVTSVQMAIVENMQREDLNPIEEATAFQYLLNDGKMTQDKLAKKLGLSRPYITNTVRLLRLPAEVKSMLTEGRIDMGHARAITSLKDEKEQVKIAKKVLSKNMSVRDTEKAVSESWHPIKQKKQVRKELPEKNKLENILEARVSIKQKNGRGVISIYYENKKQFKNIIKRIKK